MQLDTTVTIHRISLKHRSELKELCLTTPLIGEEKHIGHVLQDFIMKLPKEVELQEEGENQDGQKRGQSETEGDEEKNDIGKLEKPENKRKSQKILLFEMDPVIEDENANIYVSGLIKVAIDGYEALYKNPKSGEKFQRTPDHFEYRPYFFMLAIPKKERFALCFLHKISIHSISGLFYSNFHGYFQGLFNDYIFKASPFSTDQVFAKLKETGDINKITLVRHERVVHLEQSDDEPKQKFKLLTKTEMRIPKPRKKKEEDKVNGFKFAQLSNLLKEGGLKEEGSRFLTLEGVEGQFDDLILKMDIDGRSRTFSVSEPTKNFHPNFILANVKYKDGNPEFNSMKTKCQSLYKDLMKDAGYVVE